MNHLTVLEHLEPPVRHGKPSQVGMFLEVYPIWDTWFEMLSWDCMTKESAGGGSITAITNWPHYADHHLARLRRSASGSIAPITEWHYNTDQ
jgi:hypothetical protein